MGNLAKYFLAVGIFFRIVQTASAQLVYIRGNIKDASTGVAVQP
jgi:hypothetical protein